MERQHRAVSLVCRGSNPSTVTLACNTCSILPLVCGKEECDCENQHQGHQVKPINKTTILRFSHDLSYTRENQITTLDAIFISRGFPNITQLCVTDNQIADEGARAISQGLISLALLYVANNQLTNQGTKAIAKGLSNLKRMDIAYNWITDEGAIAVARGLPKLRKLFIQQNQLSPRVQQLLKHALPSDSVFT